MRGIRAAAVFAFALALRGQSPNPNCHYVNIDPEKWGLKELVNPPQIAARDGVFKLSVQYTDPAKTSIAGCPVTLRTYNGQLVGPTLRVKPGEALQPILENNLPVETPKEVEKQFEQENQGAYIVTRPASFNTTNLHTHGLHVSPNGNSDNVLLAIAPGTKQQYNVKLPPNHTRGTYWYHAHSHGSTSIQVGSGMAGALIVEDDESKLPKALAEASKHEKVMVIQALLYNKQGRLDNIVALFPGTGNFSSCQDADKADLATWQCSKRRITINGQIMPIITMHRGEVQRWRIVNASFRESILLTLQDHDLNEIATDGLYTGRVDVWPAGGLPLDLEPGYRTDVLVQAGSKTGFYDVTDAPSAPEKGLLGGSEPLNIIARIHVVDDNPIEPAMQLPTNAEMAPLNPFQGVDLTKTAVGVQSVIFKIGADLKGSNRNYFQVNNQAFNPMHERILKLNATEMWALTTQGDPPEITTNPTPPLPHVFHIHVNPFQMSRPGPDGLPETVWKDTLLVPAGANVAVYTQYKDFTGRFVMHCHILDHEDLGMMEVIHVTKDGLAPGMGHGGMQMHGAPPPPARGKPTAKTTAAKTALQ